MAAAVAGAAGGGPGAYDMLAGAAPETKERAKLEKAAVVVEEVPAAPIDTQSVLRTPAAPAVGLAAAKRALSAGGTSAARGG